MRTFLNRFDKLPNNVFGLLILSLLLCAFSESLTRTLEETEVNGVYFDLLKFLLTALSNLQAEEVAEEELQEGEQNAANINGVYCIHRSQPSSSAFFTIYGA